MSVALAEATFTVWLSDREVFWCLWRCQLCKHVIDPMTDSWIKGDEIFNDRAHGLCWRNMSDLQSVTG